MSDSSTALTLNDLMPFGKYRDQPLWAVAADPSYVLWAITTPSLWAQYPRTMETLRKEFTTRDFEQAIRKARREAASIYTQPASADT